jgi:hypothetical protein
VHLAISITKRRVRVHAKLPAAAGIAATRGGCRICFGTFSGSTCLSPMPHISCDNALVGAEQLLHLATSYSLLTMLRTYATVRHTWLVMQMGLDGALHEIIRTTITMIGRVGIRMPQEPACALLRGPPDEGTFTTTSQHGMHAIHVGAADILIHFHFGSNSLLAWSEPANPRPRVAHAQADGCKPDSVATLCCQCRLRGNTHPFFRQKPSRAATEQGL